MLKANHPTTHSHVSPSPTNLDLDLRSVTTVGGAITKGRLLRRHHRQVIHFRQGKFKTPECWGSSPPLVQSVSWSPILPGGVFVPEDRGGVMPQIWTLPDTTDICQCWWLKTWPVHRSRQDIEGQYAKCAVSLRWKGLEEGLKRRIPRLNLTSRG